MATGILPAVEPVWNLLSWHPTHPARSPGNTMVQLRIVCTQRPFASSS
jgi:hypothetical protein